MKLIADLMQSHIAEMPESMHDEPDSQKAKQSFFQDECIANGMEKSQ